MPTTILAQVFLASIQDRVERVLRERGLDLVRWQEHVSSYPADPWPECDSGWRSVVLLPGASGP